jgi:hypothetical protein
MGVITLYKTALTFASVRLGIARIRSIPNANAMPASRISPDVITGKPRSQPSFMIDWILKAQRKNGHQRSGRNGGLFRWTLGSTIEVQLSS